MNGKLERFFDEYDEIVHRVTSARARDFAQTLRRWFACLDDSPRILRREVDRLEELQTWDEVASKVLVPSQGMVGSGQLNWPDEKDARLGGQLLLLRRLASEEIEVTNFSIEYFYSGDNQFDSMVGDMSSALFDTHAEELRRRLEDALEERESEDSFVPISDRVVRLDHNAEPFQDAIRAVETTIVHLRGNNSIDRDDRIRIELELKSGLDLVKAPKVRVYAVGTLVIGALVWLVEEFASSAVGIAAQEALAAVRVLLGI